ncbi:MAG TPA: molybdopterin molybdotransferase MoeA [Sphingomicrobium sp.]|nr:molybdopterin molybdotransferase MoeA [Sphingomicrobium sp.]
MTLIGLAEARELLLADVPVLGSQRVALPDALGRTLASPVIASHTQPAEPRATMDGIAVPDPDPAVGTEWRLVGDAPAGSRTAAPLRSGEAIRIATGGVVPQGCKRVLPQEILSFSSEQVQLRGPTASACFVRQPGSDFNAGERLLDAGSRIGPGQVGLIAAANLPSAEVVRQPRVTICVTGDELVSPGSMLSDGKSIDSASHALAALIRCWGGVPHAEPILPDDVETITSALHGTLETCDVLVCVGGASVGARDLMRPAARALGAQFAFEGIAVQPGKPCWHARVAPAGLILGLPGNPSSAFVCAHLLLLPLMNKLGARDPATRFRTAYAKTPLPPNGSREQYLRGVASYDEEGRLWVAKLPDQDSGLQAALARSQLLIRRPPDADALDPGARVEVVELAAEPNI